VRRQFSEEFKEGAVRRVLDEGKTVGAVARELDLTPSALATWVKHTRGSACPKRIMASPAILRGSSCVWVDAGGSSEY
jgi:transposase